MGCNRTHSKYYRNGCRGNSNRFDRDFSCLIGLAYARRKNKIIAWARTQPAEYQQTWRTDQDIKRAYKNRDSRKSSNNKH